MGKADLSSFIKTNEFVMTSLPGPLTQILFILIEINYPKNLNYRDFVKDFQPQLGQFSASSVHYYFWSVQHAFKVFKRKCKLLG